MLNIEYEYMEKVTMTVKEMEIMEYKAKKEQILDIISNYWLSDDTKCKLWEEVEILNEMIDNYNKYNN